MILRNCVLNAFRHHRGRHQQAKFAEMEERMCSTPFGITEVGTRRRLFGRDGLRDVLNAFRHHRGRHNSGLSTGSPCLTCSMPFGITEVGTSMPRFVSATHTGAQRLSASQRSALAYRDSTTENSKCAQRLSASQRSAPRPGMGSRRGRAVLNAFRHHRGRHELLLLGRIAAKVGAQRLSASQRSARRHFGANHREAPVLNAFRHHRGRHVKVSDGRLLRNVVLNAFRHHRGRHAVEQLDQLRPSSVLNAFRHHRGRHALGLHGVKRGVLCSTPFGITEVGTERAKAHDDDGGLVLNAFRHHRGRHLARRAKATRCLKCSTPFGITEVGTCPTTLTLSHA